MKKSLFAVSCTIVAALGITGCSSDSATPAPESPAVNTVSPGQMSQGMMGGPGVAPMGGQAPVTPPAGGGARGGGAPPRSTFDAAPESFKKLWGGGQTMPGADGAPGAGGKPTPIVEGRLPGGIRKDPFESNWRPVVQLTPAWDLAMSHRTAPPPKFPEPNIKTGDPNIDLPPLPPIPRRVAGVFYNGAITAILESGNPPDSIVTIVQPGAEVESGVPGVGNLVVESITMESLILRAPDGRSVEVKLSGLAPAVLDALRQQFSNSGQNTGGMPGGGMPGGGMPGGGMPGGGGGKGGGGVGGAPTG